MYIVDVKTEILISLPAHLVSAYASDPDNATEWYVNIKSAEWKTPKPLSIGSQIAFKAQFMGRQLAYTYEVVEYTPGKKLVMRTASGPFPMETTYQWHAPRDGQTLMTLRNRGNPTGFSKLLAPLMARMMRKANNKDLARLKMIMEQDKTLQ